MKMPNTKIGRGKVCNVWMNGAKGILLNEDSQVASPIC
jgi:hypothetical protein